MAEVVRGGADRAHCARWPGHLPLTETARCKEVVSEQGEAFRSVKLHFGASNCISERQIAFRSVKLHLGAWGWVGVCSASNSESAARPGTHPHLWFGDDYAPCLVIPPPPPSAGSRASTPACAPASRGPCRHPHARSSACRRGGRTSGTSPRRGAIRASRVARLTGGG